MQHADQLSICRFDQRMSRFTRHLRSHIRIFHAESCSHSQFKYNTANRARYWHISICDTGAGTMIIYFVLSHWGIGALRRPPCCAFSDNLQFYYWFSERPKRKKWFCLRCVASGHSCQCAHCSLTTSMQSGVIFNQNCLYDDHSRSLDEKFHRKFTHVLADMPSVHTITVGVLMEFPNQRAHCHYTDWTLYSQE